MASDTIGACLRRARVSLPRIEADVLTAGALGVDRTILYAFPERTVAPCSRSRHSEWLARRCNGEPVAYITGTREFWSLPVEVSPHVLIPRPETEILVRLALDVIEHRGKSATVLDLGTGSGAIALALASETEARVVASDVDPRCLRTCAANAERLGLTVQVLASDWFDAVQGRYDVVVSNPPYVADADPHLDRGDLRFEPALALRGGSDGLDAQRRIIAEAPKHLAREGWLMVEHGFDQAPAVRSLFAEASFKAIGTHPDLAGVPRVTVGQQP